MLQEGLTEAGLLCIRNIRNRYDGKKRSPFDEAEAGHHYARSMMAWAGILASTKFHYSAVEKAMGFTSKPGTYFWSNGYSYGTCEVKNKEAVLKVLSGKLTLNRFSLEGIGTKKIKNKTVTTGNSIHIKF